MSRLLIQFTNLSKSYGSINLFEGISLAIHDGEIYALVGENGSGKSTLLKMLLGDLLPDIGTVSRIDHLTVGYLPQEVTFTDPAITVRKFIEEGSLTRLEEEMAVCLEDQSRLLEWAELHEEYERLGGYRRIPIEKVLSGLKLDSDLLDQTLDQLSSGQKVRVALAKALIENPNLLLLDEPTNHLDAQMVEWLFMTLKEREGASVIVSHDRKFLNRICNRLVEIKKGKLTCYSGNYDYYLSERQRLIEKQIKAYEAQEEEKNQLRQKIKALTFSKSKATPPTDRNFLAYDRQGGRFQKQAARTLNDLKSRLEELEENPIHHPSPRTVTGIQFASHPLPSEVAIELEDVSKSFGDRTLFSHLTKNLHKGDRIILMGPNGSGKTTLLRSIMGLSPIDSGKIRIASGAQVAYLDQEVALLPMDKTPLEYFDERYKLTEEELRRELHKSAIGESELIRQSFSSLSAGQRKRFMLLALILEKPNILLLDEPTNHLDLLTLEAFEKALLQFDGAILAISHDSTFIEKIGKEIWQLC